MAGSGDTPAPGAGAGAGAGGLRRYIRNCRLPKPAPREGANRDSDASATPAPEHQEQPETHEQGDAQGTPTGGKKDKPSKLQPGISLPQRVSSLLNLANAGNSGGGGGSSSTTNSSTASETAHPSSKGFTGKLPSPFRPFVPTGVDPRTPANNNWNIPAAAAGPGFPTVLPAPGGSKGRKATGRGKHRFFTSGNDGDADDDDPYDSDSVGHGRYPKISQAAVSSATGAWHNPNLMQMVETLQCAMMTKRDPMEHIPVVYNSTVLALIEGFGKLTTELKKTKREIDVRKALREKELAEFRGMSGEWINRENGYKAEIKRLELLLVKESKDGVASVALARSGSLVDRGGSKKFQARLKRMSGSQSQETAGQETVIEEPETTSIAEASTFYKTIGDIPRSIDSGKDAMVSGVVEKREMDDRRRQDPGPTGRARPRMHQNFSKEAIGAQRQISRQIEPQQQQTMFKRAQPDMSIVARSVAELEPGTNHHTGHPGAQSTGPLSEFKGPMVGYGKLKNIDDGLTVGRKGHRSDTTVGEALSPVSTGSKQYTQYKSTTGSSGNRPELVETAKQGEGASQPINRRIRRYSFSRGDDEVLPVTPLTTSFKGVGPKTSFSAKSSTQSLQDPYGAGNATRSGYDSSSSSDTEAESRQVVGVPANASSWEEHRSTSEIGRGYRLSTSTSSTGSVVWVGRVGTEHQTGNPGTGNMHQEAEDGGSHAAVSTSVSSPELLHLTQTESVIHSPLSLVEPPSLGGAGGDGTASPSRVYPSVPDASITGTNTCQDGNSFNEE